MKLKRLPSELLTKYLANKCTPEELQQINDWYSNLNLEDDRDGYVFREEELLKRIRDKIGFPSRSKSSVITVRWWRRIGQIAAAGILVLGFYLLRTDNRNIQQPFAVQSVREELGLKSVLFSNGEKKVVHHLLPDGSKVWLHPGAKIEYPLSFKGLRTREVQFSGEAFFEIAHDKEHPFKIYSGKLITEVLGTSFNLRAYENDPGCEVSVVTGKVAVSTSSSTGNKLKTIVINPNEQIVFEKATGILQLVEVAKEGIKLQNWQPVSLRFDDVPMKEVVSRLEETFNVTIALSSSRLANCRLKIDFENQRLTEILDMINVLLGATYEIDGSLIELHGDGC
jgi:transmembrane sensor